MNDMIGDEDKIIFPNECEKEILKYRFENINNFKRKTFDILLSNSMIRTSSYKIARIRKYHGVSYIPKTLLNKDRMMPDFMIPGFPRCGSTSLWHILNQHPKIFGSKEKEPHFFSYGHSEELKEYQINFPIKKKSNYLHCFEASQSYLHDRFSMKRIFDINPKMKFIVSIRNPIEKLFSTYNQLKNSLFEMKSLENCINNESERFQIWEKRHEKRILEVHNHGLCPPYLHLATYVKHIKNALKIFPKEQFLFIDFNELKDSPQNVATKCYEFLDLPTIEVKSKILNQEKYSEEISNNLKEELVDYFRPHNLELERLLDYKFHWE